MNSASVARRMISLRLNDDIASCSPSATAALVKLCRRSPTATNLAALAWDHVEAGLLSAAPAHAMPESAAPLVLADLQATVVNQFGCSLPDVIVALLAQHNGIAKTESGTALYSAEDMAEWMLTLKEIEPSLMPISGDLAGNHAVVRLNPGVSDHGAIFGFWHEDFPHDGLEPLARNAAEYLMLARHQVLDTVTDIYRGPSPLA